MCNKECGTCHDSCCVLPKRDRRFDAMLQQSRAECARIMARDPKRRTGRTTQAVQAAVLAAALGQRVAYVCGTQQLANDSCRIAADFIARSHVSTIVQGGRVSVHRDTITFYCALSGEVAGMVKFIGMGQEDGFNRGVREECKYRIIRDHHCEELLAEQERKKARRADAETIKHLMRKNGWGKVEDYVSGLTDTMAYTT